MRYKMKGDQSGRGSGGDGQNSGGSGGKDGGNGGGNANSGGGRDWGTKGLPQKPSKAPADKTKQK